MTSNLEENHVNYFSARLKHQWFDDGNEAMQVNGIHVKETCVQQGLTCGRITLSLISLKLTHGNMQRRDAKNSTVSVLEVYLTRKKRK